MTNYQYGVIAFLLIDGIFFILFLLEHCYLWVDDKKPEDSKIGSYMKKIYGARYGDGTTEVAITCMVLGIGSLCWPILLAVLTICCIMKFLRYIVRMKKSVDKLTKSEG